MFLTVNFARFVPGEEEAGMAGLNRLLAADFPGMKVLAAGPVVSPFLERMGLTHGVVMQFESVEAWEAIVQDPRYGQIVRGDADNPPLRYDALMMNKIVSEDDPVYKERGPRGFERAVDQPFIDRGHKHPEFLEFLTDFGMRNLKAGLPLPFYCEYLWREKLGLETPTD